jgi:hypothetical protein
MQLRASLRGRLAFRSWAHLGRVVFRELRKSPALRAREHRLHGRPHHGGVAREALSVRRRVAAGPTALRRPKRVGAAEGHVPLQGAC